MLLTACLIILFERFMIEGSNLDNSRQSYENAICSPLLLIPSPVTNCGIGPGPMAMRSTAVSKAIHNI